MTKLIRRGLFDNLFDNAFGSWPIDMNWPGMTLSHSIVPMNIERRVTRSEDNDNVYFRCVTPGYTENDIKIVVADGGITISGEIENKTENKSLFTSERSQFSVSYAVPEDIELDKISSKLQNGILVITFPKVPETARRLRTREIPILGPSNDDSIAKLEVT